MDTDVISAKTQASPSESRPIHTNPAFRTSKEKLRLRLYAVLVLLDIFSISAAFITGNIVRLGQPFTPQADLIGVLLPIYLVIALELGAYSVEGLERPRTGISRALAALAIALALVMGFLFYMKIGGFYSRIAFGVSTIGAFIAVGVSRYAFLHWAGRIYNWTFINKVLLIDAVAVQPKRGEIAIFTDQAQLLPTMDDPQMLDRMGRFLRYCERVIVASPPEKRFQWACMLKGMDVDAELIAPELDSLGALAIRSSEGRRTVLVSCGPLNIRARILKRVFDLGVAASLLMILSVMMLAIMLAIRLDSPGPVFFRQPRVGRGNRIFQILKFRSMRVDTSDVDGVRSTCRSDDRITRVGRFIRKTSIDELPQLFNVLKGEMSIAGPRPHALASTAQERLFWAIDNRYFERHIVKPGITGLAQIRGFRGATDTEVDLINRLQADLEYLSGWSIWRDCKILMRTFFVVFHKNAY